MTKHEKCFKNKESIVDAISLELILKSNGFSETIVLCFFRMGKTPLQYEHVARLRVLTGFKIYKKIGHTKLSKS